MYVSPLRFVLLNQKTKLTIHHGVTENTEESVADLVLHFSQT
jgi:hypothetical protein